MFVEYALRRQPGLVVSLPESLGPVPLRPLRDHDAGPAEVEVLGPFRARASHLVPQIGAVDADLSEEAPDDRPVLLLDVRVVVLVMGPGPLEADFRTVLHERRQVAVHELPAVVVVEGECLEREASHEDFHCIQHSCGASVPDRVDLRPLRLPVGRREDPEEAAVHVAAAEGDGVDLEMPGFRLGGDRPPAGAAGEVGGRLVPPRATVLAHGSRAFPLQAPDCAIHGGCAHCGDFRGRGRIHVLQLREIGKGPGDGGLEVFRAHAACGVPDPPEQLHGPVRVRPPPAPGALVPSASRRELDCVLPVEAEGLAHRVDEFGLPGLALQLRIGSPLGAYKFHCRSS